MCYLFDVLPTLGKMCGIKGPDASDGIEFSATLGDPARPARGSMVFAYKQVQRAYRDDRWKLIRYPLVDKTQLFDLKTDPQETKNLADNHEYAAKIGELTAQLEQEMKRSGDTGTLNVANPKHAEWASPASDGADAKKRKQATKR
jgi:arylsulfatase A-like enzyme